MSFKEKTTQSEQAKLVRKVYFSPLKNKWFWIIVVPISLFLAHLKVIGVFNG